MTTPNNAAALERLAEIEREMRSTRAPNACCPPIYIWADELATLRATLAQPDALTSQPSGGGELPFAFYNADANRFFWFDETIGAPVKLSGVVNLYTHPSADAPGVAVDEWRPIESAPKEAPYWVVWSAYYQRPVVVTQRSNDNTYWEGDWDFDVQATHWTAALAPKPEGGHG